MLKFYIVCGILTCSLLIGGIAGQKMLGAGKWTVLTISKCENDDELLWKVDARRRKLNRTHDALSADLTITDDLDDSCAIRIDVCKLVDGGCKPYMNIADDCLPTFVKKYAEENVKAALAGAGIDPPDFPARKGEYHIENFILDPDDLPKDGVYGNYEIKVYVIKDGADVACVKASVKYEQKDDDGGTDSPYG